MKKMKNSMTKDDIIQIAESMGFHLDYDQWDKENKEWMRFQLKEELDEPDLRLIWYKDASLENHLLRASKILFKAGQKAKIQQLKNYLEL